MEEQHLRVYENRSEYVHADGTRETFQEGNQSKAAATRAAHITQSLNSGYLEKLIEEISEGKQIANTAIIPTILQDNIRALVDSMTSEVGRALIGLTVLQLTIKALSPEQCIRLHKGGKRSNGFSWAEGISMRTIDKSYITPILRRFNLLSLNADGVMMTRGLAENYPYSSLYKAQLRGAKEQWLAIVEFLETQQCNAEEALKYLIKLLIDRASGFAKLADETIAIWEEKSLKITTKSAVLSVLIKHRDSSDYAARLLEISMHSLCQAATECNAIAFELNPLSQMRSANKKHGNVGDIEFLDGRSIVEAWDAKYGKTYLREELEELHEKLTEHPDVARTGFVTSEQPMLNEEIVKRMDELESLHDVTIEIIRFEKWVDDIFDKCISTDIITEADLAKKWLEAYTLSLAQKKRDIAPIDEPCGAWLKLLNEQLSNL